MRRVLVILLAAGLAAYVVWMVRVGLDIAGAQR